jgi:predicted glycosyltransferase
MSVANWIKPVDLEGKIWIDLDNSPHVPLFKPIIEELARRGYDVVLTARACFQVPELVEQLNLKCTFIGRHYGKNKIRKIVGMGVRALQLRNFAKREKPILALSHGSRSQLLAASMLGIPSVLMFDYEHTQSLPGIRPRMFIMPALLEGWVQQKTSSKGFYATLIRDFRVEMDQLCFYPGIKEDVYVPQFHPEPQLLKDLGINPQDLVVTIRPPATEAHYHNPESEKLFEAVMAYLSSQDKVQIVLLPRTAQQAKQVTARWTPRIRDHKIIIPEHAVDGLNMIWFSDLVISGGGTMNREAAALGVPVYSIFRGRIGAVDDYLSREGRLVLIESEDDVKKKIKLIHRDMSTLPKNANRRVLENIVDQVTALEKDLRVARSRPRSARAVRV